MPSLAQGLRSVPLTATFEETGKTHAPQLSNNRHSQHAQAQAL